MTTIALIVFWVSVGLMFHSYILYGLLLQLFAAGKKENDVVYVPGDAQLPAVFIVFSVFNEEKVIKEKLESIFKTSYPLDKLTVFVGSDNSVDGTNQIIEEYTSRYTNLTFKQFNERSGKSDVLNKLVAAINEDPVHHKDGIFIFTDANVMFEPDTIYQLVKHFKNQNIAQVGANILSKSVKADGISFQEKQYIQRENSVKYLEGLNWGAMMGAFGACYAMRSDCWTEIPENYLMEDFYLSMNVLSKGKKAILELKAICYEDVSNEMGEEFKRKSRIQAGNFQNLGVYWKLLFRFNALSFCFFSHKVIRWLGPVFILLSYAANAWLLQYGHFYIFTFLVQNLLLISPVIDSLLKRVGIHLILLRFASYFYTMNLALVNGFWMYVRGVKTSTWSPTKRNQ